MLTLLQRSCTPPRGGSAFRRGSPCSPRQDFPRRALPRLGPPAPSGVPVPRYSYHQAWPSPPPAPRQRPRPVPASGRATSASHLEASRFPLGDLHQGACRPSSPRGPLYPAPLRFTDWTRSRQVCRKRGASLGRARCPGRSDGSGGTGEDGGGGSGGAAAPVFLPQLQGRGQPQAAGEPRAGRVGEGEFRAAGEPRAGRAGAGSPERV